jgi:hypothetical protein
MGALTFTRRHTRLGWVSDSVTQHLRSPVLSYAIANPTYNWLLGI